MASFVGLKDFAGWSFTLTPATNDAGSPGFARTTQTPRHGWAAEVARFVAANANSASDVVASMRADLEVGRPPADWVETAWLAQWLAKGLIREVV